MTILQKCYTSNVNNIVEENTLHACYIIVLYKDNSILKLKLKIVFISSILGNFTCGKYIQDVKQKHLHIICPFPAKLQLSASLTVLFLR